MIYSLAYVSEAQVDFDTTALVELGENCVSHNAANEITGFLCHQNGHFLQYLEGAQDDVVALMRKIRRDPRHSVSGVIIFTEQAERRAGDWSMRVLGPEQTETSRLLGTLDLLMSQILNPYGASSDIQQQVSDMVQNLINLILANRDGVSVSSAHSSTDTHDSRHPQ